MASKVHPKSVAPSFGGPKQSAYGFTPKARTSASMAPAGGRMGHVAPSVGQPTVSPSGFMPKKPGPC